jgi:DNA mismatch repair protein MutL
MPHIQKLSPEEIKKIAAGEVVERPSNIVKELIENALDAQATSLIIYVCNGGKDSIRVIDNGHGMTAENARLSIEHHTTSKITSVTDLTRLTTFGFRGEALSSISAVSHMALSTKTDNTLTGITLKTVAGEITQEDLVSCTTGTDICVSNLFYNVPARKKFLRHKDTELNAIIHVIQAYALRYLAVSFKLFHDEKLIINVQATESSIQRMAQLFDSRLAERMLTLTCEPNTSETQITGIISDHHYTRYDRSTLFLFVNARWVKNYALTKALLKGYSNILPQGRYPAAVIHIQVPPEAVDVNVHPRKDEVLLLHARTIEQNIQAYIKTTLEKQIALQLRKSTSPVYPQTPAYTVLKTINEPSFARNTYAQHAPLLSQELTTKNYDPEQLTRFPSKNESTEILDQQSITLQEMQYHIIGQLHATYIMLEHPQGLLLVDQHAAHERILYELFAHRFEQVASVTLLFPQIVHLTTHDITLLTPYIDLLTAHGIVTEIFSPTQCIITALPAPLKENNMEQLLLSCIGWIKEFSAIPHADLQAQLHEKLHAQMACKAAVKAGDVLSLEQMHELIEKLQQSNNRMSCPHGRPTTWLIASYDIEKKFKRKM